MDHFSPARRAHLGQWAALAGSALCASQAAAQSQAGSLAPERKITIYLSLEPESLDPTMAASASVGEVVHYNILEGLTRIEENGSVSPLLAQSWSVDAGQRRYTFALRRDVRFHDGAPLDAQAVRFSFERARAPESTNKARKALFDNLADIATPNAHTVVLTLHHPDPHFLFRLGEATAIILHPDSAARAATDPVGTGPYRLQQRRAGHSITLVKVEGQHRSAAAAIQQVEFRFIYGSTGLAAALKEGEIDLFFHFAAQRLHGVEADKRYQLLLGSSSGKGLLALNHRRAPLGDVRVRRAITHAIDREGFIRHVLQGRGTVIGSHFGPSDAGYLHLAGLYPYDPERARALLREAGVVTPLRLELALPPPSYARLGGEFVAEHLAQVGIEVRLKNLEWGQWLTGPFKGDFDMTIINHVEPLDYAIYTDPQYYFGYDSAPFRALVQRYAQVTQPRERQRLFGQVQRHLAQDAVNVWIFAPQIDVVRRKGLRGVWMDYPIFVHDVAAMSWQGGRL